MILFDELKNRYILTSIELINRLNGGESIPWTEFNNFFCDEIQKDYLDVGLDYVEKLKTQYQIFEEDNFEQTKLVFQTGVEIRPSTPEKIWLKSALNHPAINLFLATETINKLKVLLENVDDYELNEKIIRKGQFRNAEKINEELIEKFRLVIRAIEEERILHYSNRANNGHIYQNQKAFVFGIEYSIIEDRFRVSLWSREEERPFKANLVQLFNLSLGQTDKKPYENVKKMLEEKRAEKPIQLKIWNKNNCVERAVMLFSQYERIARWEEDGTLIMEIDYYIFNEEEMFRHILSLGPMAVVLQPESLRQKIIETLKNSEL